ncbi:CBM35 domain-containing protein, partial [Cohnella suwonensis]
SGNVNLDYLSIAGGTVVTPPTPTTKAEAEDATLTIAKVNWDHTGYSGTGFVDNYNTGNVGATTTFTVDMASAGAADVTLRYGNGMGSAMTVSLYVNGTKIKQTSLPPTANWDTWGDKTETLNLAAGTNTIAYRYDSGDTGNVNLDFIALSASS